MIMYGLFIELYAQNQSEVGFFFVSIIPNSVCLNVVYRRNSFNDTWELTTHSRYFPDLYKIPCFLLTLLFLFLIVSNIIENLLLHESSCTLQALICPLFCAPLFNGIAYSAWIV